MASSTLIASIAEPIRSTAAERLSSKDLIHRLSRLHLRSRTRPFHPKSTLPMPSWSSPSLSTTSSCLWSLNLSTWHLSMKLNRIQVFKSSRTWLMKSRKSVKICAISACLATKHRSTDSALATSANHRRWFRLWFFLLSATILLVSATIRSQLHLSPLLTLLLSSLKPTSRCMKLKLAVNLLTLATLLSRISHSS